jgi:hypothetical protein
VLTIRGRDNVRCFHSHPKTKQIDCPEVVTFAALHGIHSNERYIDCYRSRLWLFLLSFSLKTLDAPPNIPYHIFQLQRWIESLCPFLLMTLRMPWPMALLIKSWPEECFYCDLQSPTLHLLAGGFGYVVQFVLRNTWILICSQFVIISLRPFTRKPLVRGKDLWGQLSWLMPLKSYTLDDTR